MAEEKKKNIHAGHRERMKQRFFKHGLEGFSEHEILEIFLYYALPYKNTNFIAHELINKFGSFDNAVNAEYEKLLEIDGLGSNAASMFCFFREFAKVYLRTKYVKTVDVTSKESLSAYCKVLFMNSDNEEIRIIYLNDDLTVMKETLVCTGTPGRVRMPLRRMVKEALDMKVNRVVIAHNHPRGACMPSRADVDETQRIAEMFRQIDIELVDHIIVGMDGEWSMRFNHTLCDLWKDF